LCRLCLRLGVVTPAEIADHVVSHRGDWELFTRGELQSLCKRCHNSTKRVGYASDCDENGYPIDPAHPFNAPRGGTKER
jgi:5-methylcytosine-specific restriction enzyme A